LRYRLILTDIDGTLLNQDREVTARTRAVMAELQRQSVRVVLSTARPPRTVRALYNSLGLSTPIICYNGALIYDPVTATSVAHHPIPKTVALAALATIRSIDPSLNVGLEMADEWHLDRIDDRVRAMDQAGLVPVLPFAGGLEQAIAHSTLGVSKLYFMAPNSVRVVFQERLALQGLERAVEVTSSGREFVEILAADVSKGAALRALAAILGIPSEQTVALGDEENDIPALLSAGLGIAMGNAPERVQRAAGVVTGSNTADGWAEAIERYVLAG